MLPLLLALTSPAQAWGHHYLVTDRALSRPDAVTAGRSAAVEALEGFLEAEAEGLAGVFDAHYDWLAASGQSRFSRMDFDPAEPTRAAFLRAARLNPEAGFPLVLRRLPGGEDYGFPIEPESVSPYLEEKPPLLTDFEVTEIGDALPAGLIVATFSDEPDWGFDHTLWGYTEYGYGEQPYGKPEGESSKAPFHMQFAHEALLVRKFVPTLMEGMVPDRVDLFTRLARFAFETGHDYWGWRFSAWAIHYVQDLAQPYHAKAVPSATTAFYIRYVLSPRKDVLTERATQLSANRHFLYEDFVAYGLQESYLSDDPRYSTLASYLSRGEPTDDVPDAQALLDAIMAASAEHAWAIDHTLVKAFGPELTKDYTYDVETNPDYAITTEMAGMDEGRAEELLEETGADFERAGRATRTVLSLVVP